MRPYGKICFMIAARNGLTGRECLNKPFGGVHRVPSLVLLTLYVVGTVLAQRAQVYERKSRKG